MAETKEKDGVYKVSAIHEPSVEDLTIIADDIGLPFKKGELEELQCIVVRHVNHAKPVMRITIIIAFANKKLATRPDDQSSYSVFGYISQTLVKRYQTVNDLIAPLPPTKYPRTPGYRPEPDDNLCNAWYWKCNIEGAAEGILKGKTVGVKDNVCVAGVPMMNGSKVMEGFVPDIDATVITRVLDAGGRIIGKTNCEHLCFGGTSWTNDTGLTFNPHDKARVAGGTSSGCAVAICNGEVDVAIGADQGGSIRIPASWCGIVGLKPTWGLIPYTGAVAMEITVDHLGPMARNVYDCALLLEAMAGYDNGLDPRQPRDLQVPKYTEFLDGNMKGWRVGLLSEGFDGCDDDVQAIVRVAAANLSEAGAIVEDISVPFHAHGIAIWQPIVTDGAYHCMYKGDGVGHHYKGYYPESMMTKLSQGYKMEAKHFSEPVKSAVIFGAYINKQYGNRFYGRAQNLNMKLTQAYDEALSSYDVIVMPTLPFTAPLLPSSESSLTERLENAFGMFKNTAPFDSTGHPAITVNAGKSKGLPVGMMIVGKHFDDVKVLQAAFAIEQLQHNN